MVQTPAYTQQRVPFFEETNNNNKPKQHKQQIVLSQDLNPPLPDAREEVQLLYVPLQALKQREQRQQFFPQDHSPASSQIRFVDSQGLSPQAHKQVQLHNIEQDFLQQALQAHKLQQQFNQNYQQDISQLQLQQPPPPLSLHQLPPLEEPQQLVYEPTTKTPVITPAPTKKRKPHQPPLAVYMGTKGHEDISLTDVLHVLKDAKSITVQDYIGQDSPQIFVGPSNLQSPEGYVKFELPYLSSLGKHKRVEGLDNLPFFVAPLNYKTPPGYSKIPFPSPHVGSVVINQRKEHLEKALAQTSERNLLSNQGLNNKNPNQLLLSEVSTVEPQQHHNHNRQTFSTLFPVSSTITPEIPYGPLPIKTQPSPEPIVSSTTPRTYSEPQYLPKNQYENQHRFSSSAPSSTESYSIPSSQLFSITTNRNPSRTSHAQQRPQIILSTPEYVYFDTKTESPNRYLPNVQQQVSTTTSKQFLTAQVVPNEEQFTNQHRFTDFNNQETYQVQRKPVKTEIKQEVVQQNDQEYRPSYQNVNVPNNYETRTERTHKPKVVEEKPRVVTESSFESNIPEHINHFITNQQQEQPAKQEQYLQPSLVSLQPNGYNQQQDHRFVVSQTTKEYERPTYVSSDEKVEEYHVQTNHQTDYRLPSDLPISPQLPSLVNSLEDQAIRPLLAPLLLPTAEEQAHSALEEYNPVKSSTALPFAPTPESAEVVITQEPIPETTTPYKRLRGRRPTRPTSATQRPRTSSTAHRGRRPYLEAANNNKQETESTTRATFQRTRYTSREKPQQSSGESSRETGVTQKRFRTRGRPVKAEEEYTHHTDKEETTDKAYEATPVTQRVTQFLQQEITPSHSVEENDRKVYNLQSEQPLSYLINGQHIINGNVNSNEEVYVVNKEEVPVSNEEVVKEVEQPSQEIVKRPQSIDQSQYLVETTKPKSRSRLRSRTRHTTTTPSTTTTTESQQKVVEESEESREFYGFFREPTFKPLKMEYKQSSDLRSTGPVVEQQQATFAPQYTDDANVYYVTDTRSSTPRLYQVQADEEIYENQHINARVSSAPESSYEDIKPITVRTTPSRRRTYTTTSGSSEENTSSEKYYTSRTNNNNNKHRTEAPTQRTTRIRGRIRRPTTPIPRDYTSSEEINNYSPRTKEPTSNNHRTQSRGKVHFKIREDKSSEEDLSENYPAGYLRSQEQTQSRRQPTPRPSFKLTIEPDSEEEQEAAYTTHRRQRTKSKDLVKGEESQRYEKTVVSPNQIIVESLEKDISNNSTNQDSTTEKNVSTDPVSAKLVDNSLENTSNNAEEVSEEVETTTAVSIDTETTKEVSKVEEETTVEQTTVPVTIITSVPLSSSSTESSTEKVTKKKGRRGTWRLVKQRPVDMFQPAESQNVGTIFANDIFAEKDEKGINQGDGDATKNGETTEKVQEEVKTVLNNGKETVQNNEKEESNTEEGDGESDTEKNLSFFDRLMSSLEKYSATTEKQNSDFWQSKIIGTSTTTEISHETEICYKGRCVKSLQ